MNEPKFGKRKSQIEERFFLPMLPGTRLASVTYINFYSRVAVQNNALRIIYVVITVSGLRKDGIEFIGVRENITLQCGKDMLL